MKRIVILSLLFLCWGLLPAQVTDGFEDFAPQGSFDDFQRNMEQRFSDFQDTMNSRFAKELSRQWVEFQRFDGEVRARKPKPAEQPVAPQQHPRTSDELPVGSANSPAPEPMEIPASSSPVDGIEDATSSYIVQMPPISFFSQSIPFPCPRKWSGLQLRDLSEKSVSSLWESLACEGYGDFVQFCRRQQQKLQLNDWGMFELVKRYGGQIFPYRYGEQTVFVVFVLNQLGYNVRVGRNGNQLVCLLPSSSKMYAVSYLKDGGVQYYMFSLYSSPTREEGIYTYSASFPQAKSSFDLRILKPIRFDNHPASETFSARFCGENISIPVSRSIIGFYENYPQVDLSVYANACPETAWAESVASTFGPSLEGKGEYEQVALLLSFMHRAFSYQTDDEQFGHEKFFFCEENFFYPGNDCEDRSVLFSYLVRKLVGLDVVLLDYPDHIATAVHFNDPLVSGDYYQYLGKRYIVCDPTYIGAEVGETMPMYKSVKADIIGLIK